MSVYPPTKYSDYEIAFEFSDSEEDRQHKLILLQQEDFSRPLTSDEIELVLAQMAVSNLPGKAFDSFLKEIGVEYKFDVEKRAKEQERCAKLYP